MKSKKYRPTMGKMEKRGIENAMEAMERQAGCFFTVAVGLKQTRRHGVKVIGRIGGSASSEEITQLALGLAHHLAEAHVRALARERS